MRQEQYEEAKRRIANFDSNWVREVAIGDIEYDSKSSQVRVKGHATQNVAAYAEVLKTEGWVFPPITTRQRPNGKHEIKDGNTRFLAAQQANLKTVKIQSHTETNIANESAWKLFQIQANDHEKATPNSDKDIERAIHEMVQSGELGKQIGIRLVPGSNTVDNYIKKGADFLKKSLPNSGHRVNWFENRIKKAFSSQTANTFEAYTKQTAANHYKSLTNWHWNDSKKINQTCVGEILKNRTYYLVDSTINWSPVTNGNTQRKILQNLVESDSTGEKKLFLQIDIVCYMSDLSKATNKTIDQYRNSIIDKYDELNNFYSRHPDIQRGLGNLYFLPQKKQDQTDSLGNIISPKDPNLYTLIKVR